MDNLENDWNKSSQGWMKLRSTVQLSGAIQKTKSSLKREDSFLKRFSTRQAPENQETLDTGDDGDGGSGSQGGITGSRRRLHRKKLRPPRTFVNPDDNFYFRWLTLVTTCVLYNLWTLIVRQSFPELQELVNSYWITADVFTDVVFVLDIFVQLRTGYLEQGLMVFDTKKLAGHYIRCAEFAFDLLALIPLDFIQFAVGINPILRFPRFLKVYRAYNYYYMVESRTVYPNLWRVVNLIHILLILAHWFGCFYFLLSEAEKFQGDWVYPYRPGEYATLTRKYLGSLYWSTLTLTTIGDLPTPETNADKKPTDGPQTLPRRGHKSRLLQFHSNRGYLFTIVCNFLGEFIFAFIVGRYLFTISSYLIGVFIFATIVGQVGNVITNRNANRLEFERLLDGAKTYMRHHKVPGGMKRRVLRWYDYSWSRGRIQGGGDIHTALGLLPDKLKTELALHVNLSVLKKVTIFHECQPEFLHDLVLKMKAYIFTPGDLICRKGEIAREMFIIADGILEVTSETGRILTTMQAGDFFGEIGILNLDGLNRRTADVRSVGYSELFSLSREDVLTAMRDYPEAQEILLALGTKRLMEARNMNRNSRRRSQPCPDGLYNHAKCQKKRLNSRALQNSEESESSEDGSQNNRNAAAAGPLGASDPTTGKKIVDKLKSGKVGLKSVLRRSRKGSRTKEEDIELQPLTTNEDGENVHTRECRGELSRMGRVRSDDTSLEDGPSTSPPQDKTIGAGLPLLQRLKLLKEKQEKEGVERNIHVVEVQVMNEREPGLVGPGQPLLQRDHLLKQQEGTQRDVNAIQTTASETAQVLASTVRTQFTSPLFLRLEKSQEEPTLISSTPQSEPNETYGTRKYGIVSWKDSFCQEESNKRISIAEPTVTGNDSEYKNYDEIICLSQNNNTSIPNSTDPYLQSVNETSLRDQRALPLPGYTSTQSYFEWPSGSERLEPFETNVSSDNKDSITFAQDLKDAQINSISNPNVSSHFVSNKDSACMEVTPSDSEKEYLTEARKLGDTQLTFKITDGNKICKSNDDPSPESSGLPIVEKLRALYERQRSAKHEEITRLRSFSLDTGYNLRNREFNKMYDTTNLNRSNSETLVFEVVLQNQQLRAKAKAAQQLEMEQTVKSPDSLLVSPESNETVERRQLKSILKKLSSTSLTASTSTTSPEVITVSSNSPTELRKLMRAQTVEGYAARHTKLSKSVTFNRDTLESPPHDPTSNGQQPLILFTKVHSSLDSAEQENKVTQISELDTPHCSNDHLVTNLNVSESVTPGASDNAKHYFSVKTLDAGTQTNVVNSFPIGTPHSSMFEYTEGRDIPTGSFEHFPASETQEGKKILNPTEFSQIPQGQQNNFYRPGPSFLPTCTQEDEFFGGLLNGIKEVIKKHLEEVQGQFQRRFNELELEVRDRDGAILDLQSQIYKLEKSGLYTTDVEESSGAYFMRENSIDTVLLGERGRSTHCPGCSWEKPSMEGHPDCVHDHEHVEDPDLIEHFEHDDPDLIDCLDEDELNSLDSSDEDLDLLDLTEEEEPDEIETPRPIPTHPFESFTATDIESDTSDTDSEGGVFPPGGHNDWEVRMLAAELDRRESQERRKARLLRSASLRSRRRVVTHTCHGRCGRTQSPGEFSENGVRRRPPLVTAQSLDDHSGCRSSAPLYKRSMSYGNIQNTGSSSTCSSGKSLGALFQETKPQTSHESTAYAAQSTDTRGSVSAQTSVQASGSATAQTSYTAATDTEVPKSDPFSNTKFQ